MVTAIVTALLAVLVFVVTQSFLKLVLEPIQEQRKLIGEVAHALLFYANVYHLHMVKLPDEERKQELEETRKALRELAGRLRASLWTIPFCDTLALLRRVPKREDVLKASDQLVVWSNSLYGSRGSDRSNAQRIIADRLGISKRIEIH